MTSKEWLIIGGAIVFLMWRQGSMASIVATTGAGASSGGLTTEQTSPSLGAGNSAGTNFTGLIIGGPVMPVGMPVLPALGLQN